MGSEVDVGTNEVFASDECRHCGELLRGQDDGVCHCRWEYEERIKKLRATMTALLKVIGNPARCRGCGVNIMWVRTRTGQAAPFDEDGTSHFATCPKAAAFRRKSNGEQKP